MQNKNSIRGFKRTVQEVIKEYILPSFTCKAVKTNIRTAEAEVKIARDKAW